MIDRMKLIIEIPNELHKKLKMKALTNDTTLKDMILPSLEKLAQMD